MATTTTTASESPLQPVFGTKDDFYSVQKSLSESMEALLSRDNPARFVSNPTLAATYLASKQILSGDPDHANAAVGASAGAIGCMCLAFNDAIGPKKVEPDASEVEFLAVGAFFISALFLTEATAKQLWGMCWDPLMVRVPLLPKVAEIQERQMRVMEAAVRGVPELETILSKARAKGP